MMQKIEKMLFRESGDKELRIKRSVSEHANGKLVFYMTRTIHPETKKDIFGHGESILEAVNDVYNTYCKTAEQLEKEEKKCDDILSKLKEKVNLLQNNKCGIV